MQQSNKVPLGLGDLLIYPPPCDDSQTQAPSFLLLCFPVVLGVSLQWEDNERKEWTMKRFIEGTYHSCPHSKGYLATPNCKEG